MLLADSKAAKNFTENFQDEVGSSDSEFLYNANENGLIGKSLPKTISVSIRKYNTPGYKISKDRVKVLNCADSMRSHKLTPRGTSWKAYQLKKRRKKNEKESK